MRLFILQIFLVDIKSILKGRIWDIGSLTTINI